MTGEHAGLANLVPGNPGTVDPPEFNAVTPNATGGTFTAGSYTYAITDQFSTTGGESTASQATTSAPVVANGSVTIEWDAACHAAQYKLYREVAGSNAWSLIATIPATSTDFGNTGSNPLTYPDTGAAGTAATLPTTNNASESPYQQNTALAAAFTAAHITHFGSDASKPYPNPAAATFATGSPPATQYAKGATFPDAGATAIPRYPTNIYYNVATNAQEVNEYETLYDSPTCKPITGITVQRRRDGVHDHRHRQQHRLRQPRDVLPHDGQRPAAALLPPDQHDEPDNGWTHRARATACSTRSWTRCWPNTTATSPATRRSSS